MASILICCSPARGHVDPLLAVARHLAAAGHELRFLTGHAYEERVRAAGIEFLPLPAEADFDLDHATDVLPELAGMRGIPAVRHSVINLFMKPAAPQFRAVEAELAARPADVVLTEMMFLGATLLVQRPADERPPLVMLGIFPLTLSDPDVAPYGLGIAPMPGPLGRLRNRLLEQVATRLVFAPVIDAAKQVFRSTIGEAPPDFAMFDVPASADLMLQFTVPGFEYPRPTLPPNVRFIGPIARTVPTSIPPPEWWGDLDDGRPVVHVSQGTVSNFDLGQLVIPTMAALAEDDVLVVAATGGRPVEELGPLPQNARAAEFLPYDLLFPRLAAYVSNGGYGGLHYALEHGVPIVAAGVNEDKLETTARVAWSGAGINLRSDRPRPAAIRRAVQRVLADSRYREASGRIGAQIAASPGLAGIDAAIAELVPAGA